MNAVFYYDEPNRLFRLIQWLDINIINDLEQAAHTKSTLIFWQYLETELSDEKLAVIRQRQSQGLKTKLVFDRSYEDCSSVALFESIAEKYQQMGVTDLCFILNTSILIDSTIDQFMQQHPTLLIDFFALDAVYRVKENFRLASPYLLIDRPNTVNILVSKLRSRHTRYMALYEFWSQGLLIPETVTGILADRQDLVYHITQYPESYNREFWWALVARLGPADQTETSRNDQDGHTSDTGWGMDSRIYDCSRISYICETVDVMTGGHNGRNHKLISEKTYRSIINGTAFVVQGAAGFLSNLRSLGFETWSSFVDESYNDHQATTIEHIEPAVAATVNLLAQLQNQDRLSQAQEIVNHNRQRLSQLGQQELTRVIDQLTQWSQ